MQIDAVINVAIGIISGTITASIARFYIARSINQLDTVANKINLIKEDLTVVIVKMQQIENIQNKVFEHESKIAVMESNLKHYKFR